MWYRPLGDEFICRLSAAALPIGSENQTTSLRSWKCTPSAYGTSPRESVSRNFQSPCGSLQISFACHPGGGGLLSASLSANLSRSLYSGARSSPLRGKGGASAPKGVHFPRAKGAVGLFSHGRKPGCMVLSYWRPSFPKGAHHLRSRSSIPALLPHFSLPSHDSKPYPPAYQRIEYEEEGQGGGDEGGFR